MEATLDNFPVTIGSVTTSYAIRATTAPKAYDGFGTFTIADCGDDRIVAIRTEHLEWQDGRYRSGMHTPETPNLELAAIEESLYNRLTQKDSH